MTKKYKRDDAEPGRGAAWLRRSRLAAYFRALWAGTEPLHRVVISDLLIGGTLINVVAFALALALFALGAPRWLGVAVFFSPQPFNLFLVAAVWRTASVSGSGFAWPARILALAWFGCMVFI
jgi:hypothetical protein